MQRNPTSYVILGLLSVQANLSGYDIRKAVQGSIGYFWGESYGQIYPALKRLAGEGLIAESRVGSNGRKQRQQYVLTRAGRAALREWLALPFHNEPPRNEFLLKLFFAAEGAPGVAIAHLRDLQQRNQQALEIMKKIEPAAPTDQPPNPHFPYWMLTLSLGKALTLAALDWGEKALAALAALEESAAAPPQPRTTPPQASAVRARKSSAPSRKHLRAKRYSARSERKVSK